MQTSDYEIYEKSINKTGSLTVFMAKEKSGETVIFIEPGDNTDSGFTGTKTESGKLRVPLTHENAEVLRKLFPFTKPVRGLGKPQSFGLGDRLGIATPGHIDLFEKYNVFPIFAQQSIRELNLTNRTYADVLDAASFAVYREGYKKGFGADGDHLKTAEDVEYALSLGFTMITLDCSEHIKNNPDISIPLDKKYAEKYLGKQFDIESGISLTFFEDELKQCIGIYGGAIVHVQNIYNNFFASGKYDADFEISIDETSFTTTPLQHFFVARELLDAGIKFATIAPRFCGEFQKGIDYKGDIKQFDAEIKVHAAISRHFGYKLSIHSGSDKFSVFPSIGRETKGSWHVKTAGTNWLEAMSVIAKTDPALYREIHVFALSAFNEAIKYYHVTTDLTKIPDVNTLKDTELPELFNNNDARQLIHITYGLILGVYKDRLYKLWRENESVYREYLKKHIGKHLRLLEVNHG